MGLSRLQNLMRSPRGNVIYVDVNSLDATDSIENQGNSPLRPMRSLQRAICEAVRFSYQKGPNNDRFGKTTIIINPGEYFVDNRPGHIVTGTGTYATRSGQTGLIDLTQWDLDTNFDLTNPNNALYKLNSVFGGIIIPRGISLVATDLRKTKIRPLYVPNPQNDNIERSAIFRVTGGCYFWQFTVLDADPNGNCYVDYNSALSVPNFSHHKLTVFEYADGVNPININDTFLSYSTTRTDLDMYYEKVAAVYGQASGRDISPDYGQGIIDIQPIADEYRIVGSTGRTIGISSIFAGDGITPSNTITVNLTESITDLNVDAPIQISGVSVAGYDGQYVVSTVPSSTQITYKTQNPPSNPNPTVTGATLNLVVDTVNSASPYIFNVSLRSVYGMCGLLADGNKATGFKSMVVAQYTGIGLQKDDNAFVKYNDVSGEYENSNKIANLHTNSKSRFKPSYENFHIKATNNAFLQLVSVFAIGYAQHFVTENGGDIALNNSNSNFGAKALVSSGFKNTAFTQDDYGYITHIIPPREIESNEISVEFSPIDVGLTTSKSVGAASTDKLYLYNETDVNSPPKVIIDGYHVGARSNETLKIQVYRSGISTTYSSTVVMPCGSFNSTQVSSEKVFTVGRSSVGINSITSNTLTLTGTHSLINGESIRIISNNAHLPDGLNSNQIYYAITNSTLGNNRIKIAKTLNDAINDDAITLNNKGGILSIVSRVSDKNPGDTGHPVQWDPSGNWYVNVSSSDNEIYDAIKLYGTSGLGNATSRTYVNRTPNSRNLIDTLYRVRYVLPKDSPITARPPVDGFILQESNNVIGGGSGEISQLYDGTITNSTQLRTSKFIADASYSGGQAIVRSEIRHNLRVGDSVEVVNVTSTNNTSGTANLGYNGTHIVTSIVSAKEFSYSLSSDPGTFTNNTSLRTELLPYYRRKIFNKTYQVYRTQEVQSYVPNIQDGIYYLTLVNHSNSPTVTPFTNENFSQPIVNLYPQVDRDNPNSDPQSTVCHALPSSIGEVVVNDPKNSITKETLESFVIGYGVTNIQSSTGTAHTIYTSIDHGLSGITSVSIISSGSNYGNGSSGTLYNARLVGFAGSTTGFNATAKITLGSSGDITSVKILDGGSAYGIGNTLSVVGVATTSGFVSGVVRVESVTNNLNDTLQIIGVTSSTQYNTLYRVSEIVTGKSKEINVVSSNTITGFSSVGIGSILTSSSKYVATGKAISVSSLTYDQITGIATVGFTTSHGFLVDNKIQINGANESFFNGNFIIKRVDTLTTAVVNIGIGTTSTTATGTIHAYRPTLTSYGGELTNDTEGRSGRLCYDYAGITTTLGTELTKDETTTTLNIPNAVSLGLNIGDYLLIDNEVFRVSESITSNTVSIFRGLIGSPRQTHGVGSVIRKINVFPVELRRNSIIRASGHTFEYLGYGPGNYSTSLPEKQDRALSIAEKFLAQATKTNGGIVVYTGMNSDGDFFAGNKKINSATGREETFDTPIPTNTQEKEIGKLVNITETQKIFVTESIKVDGGKDKNVVSEFYGPVVFNDKVTSNSNIEAPSLLIQGKETISREISISESKPTKSGNYGDLAFNSVPQSGENVGWIYTTENDWQTWGWINKFEYGIGISSNGTYVGFSTLINIVGNGVTIGVSNDSVTGIATLTLDANPKIGISSGAFNTFIGNASQINFVGYGITVQTTYSNSGIATVTLINTPTGAGASTPGLPNKSIQYNNSGSFSGIPVFTYNDVDNNLVIDGSSNNSLLRVTQSGNGNSLIVEDQTNDTTPFVVSNNGSVGIGNSVPTAKLDIFADNQTAVNITSINGFGNIIRINNSVSDTTPVIIDVNGNVGINTVTARGALDVTGNAVIFGSLRIYESDASNYIGLQAGALGSDLLFTLPNSYGTNGQVLTSNGSGVLSWTTVSVETGNITEIQAGSGITVSNSSGPTVTISNNGITDIVAGTNIAVTKNGTTATIDATVSSAPYPFTTRGFSMMI